MKRDHHQAPPRRITLFTNLSYVSIGDVCTMCEALILEPRDPADDKGGFLASRDKIRGFGLGPSNPVFDLFPPSLEYTSEDGQSPHVFIGDGPDAQPRPLASGVILTFKGGPTLQLIAGSHGRAPIHVETVTSADHSTLYDTLWATMERRIAEFCDTPFQLVVTQRSNANYGRNRRGG